MEKSTPICGFLRCQIAVHAYTEATILPSSITGVPNSIPNHLTYRNSSAQSTGTTATVGYAPNNSEYVLVEADIISSQTPFISFEIFPGYVYDVPASESGVITATKAAQYAEMLYRKPYSSLAAYQRGAVGSVIKTDPYVISGVTNPDTTKPVTGLQTNITKFLSNGVYRAAAS